MKLPFTVIELLKRKSGSDLRLPSDCELLSLDIEGRTGVHIGATTLKRLLGFAADERKPHVTTLDAIAHYFLYQYHDNAQSSKETLYQDFINFKDKPYGYEQIASR